MASVAVVSVVVVSARNAVPSVPGPPSPGVPFGGVERRITSVGVFGAHRLAILRLGLRPRLRMTGPEGGAVQAGCTLMEVPHGHPDETAWWLAQFGEGVRVHEPPELRARLRRIGEEIVRLNAE
ncbi:MAG: WYL domain-containing protein [Planctomycetes bacterium]|nr:WYL domain-containing protein [Planctomycetota bacterium]